MWKAKLTRRYDCQYFAAVHDELCFSIAITDLGKFIPEVHSLMVAPYASMTMPVRSSCSFGPSFGQQTELNGDFSLANIQKALANSPKSV